MKRILIAMVALALLSTPARPQPFLDLAEATFGTADATDNPAANNETFLQRDSQSICNSLVAASEFTFSVTGDIPYTSGDVSLLEEHVADHNLFSPSDFFVHVGDIKSGASACVESAYKQLAAMLKKLALPTFIIPGDNEWNDCVNFDEAWSFWEDHMMAFEQNFCGVPPALEKQEVRPENFAFTHKGVLVIGINIVGGLVHDPSEWAIRLQQNGDWVNQHFVEHAADVRAAVVFGHAGPNESRTIFFDQFVSESTAFGKPVIYIHGDGHVWRDDRPFPEEPKIRRIQIQRNNPPLHVTVTLDPKNTFALERDPWPKGTRPFNRPPCVDVGSEVAATPCATTVLSGTVGTDELLLTADDTESQQSRQILVNVLEPVFSDDFESGTTSAWSITFP